MQSTFLLRPGGFLLAVKLFYLQLCTVEHALLTSMYNGVFWPTVGAILPTMGAFLFRVEAFLLM